MHKATMPEIFDIEIGRTYRTSLAVWTVISEIVPGLMRCRREDGREVNLTVPYLEEVVVADVTDQELG